MSGKKGYMTGSAFHIENTHYKFAVEKSDSIKPTSFSACLKQSKNHYCCLINSGFYNTPCMYFKCRYLSLTTDFGKKNYPIEIKEVRKSFECAYYNSKKECIHPKMPNLKCNDVICSYCCYYNPSVQLKNIITARNIANKEAEQIKKREEKKRKLLKRLKQMEKLQKKISLKNKENIEDKD